MKGTWRAERIDGEDDVFVRIRVMKAGDKAQRWTCLSKDSGGIAFDHVPSHYGFDVFEL